MGKTTTRALGYTKVTLLIAVGSASVHLHRTDSVGEHNVTLHLKVCNIRFGKGTKTSQKYSSETKINFLKTAVQYKAYVLSTT